jgi:hypothetical protein
MSKADIRTHSEVLERRTHSLGTVGERQVSLRTFGTNKTSVPRDNALKRHAPHKPSDANETSALLVRIRIRNRQTRFVFQKAAVWRLPSEHLFFEKPSP